MSRTPDLSQRRQEFNTAPTLSWWFWSFFIHKILVIFCTLLFWVFFFSDFKSLLSKLHISACFRLDNEFTLWNKSLLGILYFDTNYLWENNFCQDKKGKTDLLIWNIYLVTRILILIQFSLKKIHLWPIYKFLSKAYY